MKLFKHLHTVHTHRKAVRKLCFKCGLYKQGLLHDLSKYSPTEFIPSVKYWTGKKSPLEIEKNIKGYSLAWNHHKGRNKHHFEYWLDPTEHDGATMPVEYVAESFCDRTAASKVYLGDKYTISSPRDYLLAGDRNKAVMGEGLFNLYLEFFTVLAEQGEDQACQYVKRYLKEHRGEVVR